MVRFLVPLALASTALAAVPAAAQTAPVATATAPVTGTVLDLSATGEATRVPDVALVSAGVVTQGATAAEASRANATQMAQVIAALRRAGVAERDVQTAQLSLEPRYQYGENQPPVITGYQASNSVQIRFRDLSKAGGIVDALVSAGANQVQGPNLTVDRPEAALDEARADAMQRARARAELYARAAGLRVKRILSIGEQADYGRPVPIMLTARMAGESAPQADTAIVPGEQKLTVTLNVRFELE